MTAAQRRDRIAARCLLHCFDLYYQLRTMVPTDTSDLLDDPQVVRRKSVARAQKVLLSMGLALLLSPAIFPAQDAVDYAKCFNHAQELMQQLRFHDAAAELREAVKLNPSYFPAHQALVLVYAVTECFDLAWQEVEITRQLGGEPPAQLMPRLERELPENEARVQRERNAQELDSAQQASVTNPKRASAQGRLALALLRTGDFPAASQQAYRALSLDPLEPQAQFVVATILGGDPPTFQEALPHWKLYLEYASRSAEPVAQIAKAYERVGRIYHQLGKEEESLTAFENGLKVDPDNAQLLNAAAWSYATTPSTALRNPAKALAYAQKAVASKQETRPELLDTLGEALYANGRFDEAIAAEKRALALDPESDFYASQLKKFQTGKDHVATLKKQ